MSYFGAPNKSGQKGSQSGGSPTNPAPAKWMTGQANSPRNASNRHTRIDRSGGATAANPASYIKAMKAAAGLKSGPARGV
jgi:hypothetical protein